MSDLKFKNKYLKYKNKYINLKNQEGGAFRGYFAIFYNSKNLNNVNGKKPKLNDFITKLQPPPESNEGGISNNIQGTYYNKGFELISNQGNFIPSVKDILSILLNSHYINYNSLELKSSIFASKNNQIIINNLSTFVKSFPNEKKTKVLNNFKKKIQNSIPEQKKIIIENFKKAIVKINLEEKNNVNKYNHNVSDDEYIDSITFDLFIKYINSNIKLIKKKSIITFECDEVTKLCYNINYNMWTTKTKIFSDKERKIIIDHSNKILHDLHVKGIFYDSVLFFEKNAFKNRLIYSYTDSSLSNSILLQYDPLTNIKVDIIDDKMSLPDNVHINGKTISINKEEIHDHPDILDGNTHGGDFMDTWKDMSVSEKVATIIIVPFIIIYTIIEIILYKFCQIIYNILFGIGVVVLGVGLGVGAVGSAGYKSGKYIYNTVTGQREIPQLASK